MAKRTRINEIRNRYPSIMEGFHGTEGYEDKYFEPDGDIDQDEYDREL